MQTRTTVAAGAAVLAALLVTSPPVVAGKRVTGKLSKPGYTVVALDAHGEARAYTATKRRFRVRAPARRVTLHLRDADGRYAGPIVLDRARRGKRAIVGVAAGAALGRVKVKAGRGFATVTKELPARRVDEKRFARAHRGAPIGAGVFGRVRSRAARGPRDDRDLDGIPDALDIDDDGDLVLDNLERPAGAGASQAESTFGLHAFTGTGPNPQDTVNANARLPGNADAPAFSDAELSAVFARYGEVLVGIPDPAAELDCGGMPDPADPDGWIGGLPYCTRGGTGDALTRGGVLGGTEPFPGPPGGYFDPDGDGLGSLVGPTEAPQLHLAPRVTACPDRAQRDPSIPSQICTGDELIERVPGSPQVFVGNVPEVIATNTTLESYRDGAGNQTAIPYPLAPGSPGTPGGELPIFPCPSGAPSPCEAAGDMTLTLEVWQPQRRPIGQGASREACLDNDPPCAWVDVGGLTYQVGVGGFSWGGTSGYHCPQSSLSTTMGPGELRPAELGEVGGSIDQAGGFTHLAADRAADPANVIIFSVNITRCLADLNAELQRQGSPDTLSWPQGEVRELQFVGRGPGNVIASGTSFWFERS